MKVYAYYRRSKEENAQGSIETQKVKIHAWCKLNGYTVDEEYEDFCSGGKLFSEREKGFLISEKIKKGDLLICSVLDRFSRNHSDLVNTVTKYKKLGIKIAFTDLGIITDSDSLGTVFYQILSIMSEWYRKSLSEKQLIAKDKLRKQGRHLGGKVKKGFDIADDGKTLVLNNKEQKEINMIVALRKSGLSFRKVTDEMMKKTNKKWTQSFVWKLYNRAMTEDVITGDSVIANDFRNAYCKKEIDFKNGERSYNLS
jgi:DNA invertase Pin-like site-specific DNA recombinase